MPGGLLNLVSYGNQNIILNGNPSKTFFKTVYKKYTNFGLQKFRIDFKGQRVLHTATPTTLKFTVPRYADLLMDTYLVVTLPNIWSPILPPASCDTSWRPYEFKWIDNLGSNMIKEVKFTIGGHTIQKFSGQYLYNMVERDFSGDKKKLYYDMTGNVPELNNPAYAFNRNGLYPNAYYLGENYTEKSEPSIRGRKLYIPLNIWFTLSSKMALPLVSLQYAELEIEIELRPIQDLFVIRDPTPSKQPRHGTDTHVTSYNSFASPDNIRYNRADLAPYIRPSFNIAEQQLHNFLYSPPSISLNMNDYKNTYGENMDKRVTWDADIHLISTYAFLSKEEVCTFTKKPQTYLVREVHEYTQHNLSESARVELDTTGLVANWMWFLQRTDIVTRNAWSNYTNWDTNTPSQPLVIFPGESQINTTGTDLPTLQWDDTNKQWVITESPNVTVLTCPGETGLNDGLKITPGQQIYTPNHDDMIAHTGPHTTRNVRDIMLRWGLLLDGKYRENMMDVGVYNYIEKYVRTYGNGPNGQFCYNFCLSTNPFDFQPSGAINLSKFSKIEFELVLITPPLNQNAQVLTICDSENNNIGVNKPVWNIYEYTYDLTVIEERINIVRFESGTAGLIYTR